MACFLVGAAEALVVSGVEKHEEKVEKERQESGQEESEVAEFERVPLSKKLRWLRNMLWGGVILLAFEHVWHGEVVPWFPFLTAMSDPGDTAEMLHEMGTIGVAMVVIVTAVWLVMCKVSDMIMASPEKTAESEI